MAGRASIKIANGQTLTGTYALTSATGAFQITEESLATLDIQYTTGASETAAYLEFKVEYSYDGSTWVSESYSDLVSGVNTLAPITHKIAGGAGGTAYTGQYFVPLCSRHVRVYVKETGVSSNFGTVTVIVTMAAGMGMQRNQQETSLTATSVTIGAGTALIGKVSSSVETSTIYNGTTALTPKFAFANVAASQTDSSIVAAVTSKKIRVHQVAAVAGGTATNLTFNSKPGGAGTAISPLFANTSNSGEVLPFSPMGWFETVSGEGLTVTTGAGSTTGIIIGYTEV